MYRRCDKDAISGMMYKITVYVLTFFIKLFSKVHIVGKENIPLPPYIIVSNHMSMIDPPLVGYAFIKHNVDFMTKSELFSKPLIGSWLHSINCIPVYRNRSGINCLREALRRIKCGRVVGIFPEGTRSPDGNLTQAKRGVGFLVAKATVPVVPVYIQGTFEALQKGKMPKFGAHISIVIGKAIYPDELSSLVASKNTSYDFILDIIMSRIRMLRDTFEKELSSDCLYA